MSTGLKAFNAHWPAGTEQRYCAMHESAQASCPDFTHTAAAAAAEKELAAKIAASSRGPSSASVSFTFVGGAQRPDARALRAVRRKR